ncbi:phospholipase A and acyltransferase 3-like [Mercenaria mercenaria]|uniref:phospholipase A and acyltransferase 3-like n=1 Tax=Mercenaria mercenaria TaxID=6596 RepID=UPI001E1E093B|nr:phospholipase A and acyltransferase 3-like [Mercenaria mercenaria]
MAALAVQQHNSTVFETLERGDLVEFHRGVYSHWAVYAGEGKVIHLAGDENDGLNANVNSGSLFTICGTRFRKAFVKVDDFWNVVCDSKVYKNNDKDKKMSPSKAEEIIERAMNMVGEIGYNVLWSNCEHFASYCRYGKSKSDQADKFLTWAAIGTITAAILGLALGSKSKEKKEKEQTE